MGPKFWPKVIFFGSVKDAGIFFGSQKKPGIFWSCEKRTKQYFGYTLKKQ